MEERGRGEGEGEGEGGKGEGEGEGEREENKEEGEDPTSIQLSSNPKNDPRFSLFNSDQRTLEVAKKEREK